MLPGLMQDDFQLSLQYVLRRMRSYPNAGEVVTLTDAGVIRASHAVNVEKLLFLGSSCIYPRLAKQPISEDELLTGPLEPTNEWYAIAKIAGGEIVVGFGREQAFQSFQIGVDIGKDEQLHGKLALYYGGAARNSW